ncbi:MAG: cytidine deaminase [Crocinitomicaceae bacterium]|jgi:cytidine deaminase|nr:cytidine deaminase [Crocinitomicaceae bacterium]
MRKKIEINYEYFENIEALNKEELVLFQAADQAMENAYAPYSKFKVGAALLLEDGTIVKGSNQENVAYPSGLCAERTAIFAAGSNYPDKKIKKIAIVAKGDLISVENTLSPCGACRQVMAETESRQREAFEILLRNFNGSVVKFKGVSSLLPFIFGA